MTFRYVKLHDIQRMLDDGWTVSSDLADCHHGEYAVLMVKHD